MKSIKSFFVAALLAVSASAMAQFTNTSASGGTSTDVNTDGWSTFYVQYNPISLEPDKGDGVDFSGFSVGFNKAFSVSQNMPFFVETGLGLQYMTTDELQYDDEDITFFSIKMPLNLAYKFSLNENFSIIPYAGATLRYNIIGKSDDLNLYDEDDVQEEWKRFQFGWQVGLNAHISKTFSVGVSYGQDFSDFVKKDIKLNTTSITIGYNF